MSAATLRAASEVGHFRWAASSAAVLRGSLQLSDAAQAAEPLSYNRPYRPPGMPLDCFFRDDPLSDLIGFTYATWHGDDAARNLAGELGQLAERYRASDNHAVLIALDGENAWEHYPFNGYYFLRALYAALTDHPQFELHHAVAVPGPWTYAPHRCTRSWPAAGCTARWPPGWGMPPRTAPGTCCARRS